MDANQVIHDRLKAAKLQMDEIADRLLDADMALRDAQQVFDQVSHQHKMKVAILAILIDQLNTEAK